MRYFKKSLIRYLAYAVAVGILTLLLSIINTNAATMPLGTPTTCMDFADGSTSCGKGTLETWWSKQVYRHSSYFYQGSTSPVVTQWNYQWTNAGLCGGEDILIKGKMNGISGFYTNGGFTIKIYSNGSEGKCSWVKDSNDIYSFTCSGQGGGSLILVVDNDNQYKANTLYTLSVDRNLDVTCAATNSTIIEEAHKNTQSIIDNNNSNTQKIIDSNNQNTQAIQDMNDTMNNSDTSEATSGAGDFFSGFSTDTFGLTSIITAPLQLIGSLTSSTCSPLGLTMPFVDYSFYLPCMTSIYREFFGDWLDVYQTITFGVIAYGVCVQLFYMVKGFKDPENDQVEVMDL